jgi:hypothetical protein
MEKGKLTVPYNTYEYNNKKNPILTDLTDYKILSLNILKGNSKQVGIIKRAMHIENISIILTTFQITTGVVFIHQLLF